MTFDLSQEIPPTFQSLLLNDDRFLILKGSAGSSKSVSMTKKLVFRCIHEGEHKHLVMRKIQNTLRESIFEEVQKRIVEWGLNNRLYYHVNKSELKIYLKDSQFVFMGMDDPEKLKSISGITSLTFEEMTEFNENDFDQANLRLRGKTKYYKQTIGMFNPIDEDHWIKKRFFDAEQTLPTTIHESTYKDNPFLDDEYKALLESYKETNNLYYQVYCLGNWGVVDKSNKFLYAFDDSHINDCSFDPSLPVKLSFDFNLEPFATICYQMPDPNTINVFDSIRLNNSDIYQVCDRVKSKFPDSFFICTGDVSGKNRTGVTAGKTSYWSVIKDQLALKDPQIRLRGKNIPLIESRVLCNSALQHKNINVDPKLKELIRDAKYSKVDEKGVLVKDRKDNKNDFLDTFRYCLDAEFPEIIKHQHKQIAKKDTHSQVFGFK